jgi:phosphoglycerate dehydrogenase-like enzyme
LPLVVVPDNLGYPSTLPDRFTAGLEDVRHYNDLPDAGEFISRCRDADALIWAWTRLTPAILDQCPNLKIVSFMGVGASDRIDLNHAWAKGIVVCNTPHYGDHAVAELGFAILLALTRRVTRADRSVRESRWEQNELEGVGLLGKTMGVVGLGGSGARMAAFANAFGMRVLATTARPSPQRADEHHVEFVPLDDLLSRSDVVSVHVALTERTRHMIGQEQLALMKPAAFLVNMARAEVVDTGALARALRDGRIAGAAVDVWDEEPPPPGHPLLGLENTVLTPHLGWNADTAKWRMLEIAVENVRAFFAGSPQNVLGR